MPFTGRGLVILSQESPNWTSNLSQNVLENPETNPDVADLTVQYPILTCSPITVCFLQHIRNGRFGKGRILCSAIQAPLMQYSRWNVIERNMQISICSCRERLFLMEKTCLPYTPTFDSASRRSPWVPPSCKSSSTPRTSMV